MNIPAGIDEVRFLEWSWFVIREMTDGYGDHYQCWLRDEPFDDRGVAFVATRHVDGYAQEFVCELDDVVRMMRENARVPLQAIYSNAIGMMPPPIYRGKVRTWRWPTAEQWDKACNEQYPKQYYTEMNTKQKEP